MEEEKNLKKIDENNNIKEEKENKENNMDKAKEEIKKEVKEENKENKNEDNDKKDEQKTKKEDNNNEKENEKGKDKEEIDTKVKKENKENKDNLYKESTEPFMQIASKELIELINNPENRKCFDCESSPANWLCVNNAIYLCSKCAGEHRGYGTIISNLKFMMLDKLNEFQIEIMKRGGNKKLDKLLIEYNIDKKKIDKLLLYSSKLLEYHRDYLYNKLAGKIDPKPPTKFDANKIMNNFKDNPRPPLEKVKKIKENIINNKEETNKTEKESKIGNCKAQ
jgi:hypothetical protein